MTEIENYSRSKHYQQKNYADFLYSGFVGMLFKWHHKLLSPKIYESCDKVLEIGPGFEPHIKFVKLNYKEYYCLELEIDKNIDHKNYYKKNFPNIVFDTYNGKNLNFRDNFFDRIIISHTLEHILDFESFLNEMIRVIKPSCVISIAVPCDNGFLWRFGRYLMKKFYNRKIADIDFDYLVAKEHVNTIYSIIAVLKKKFNIHKELYLPFKIKIIDINLFYICHILKK
jgi:phosphatidylethanolamine/phosphatidyl-N-methylethanolamine N-methyltransferase